MASADTSSLLRIFVPSEILSEQSGLLFGLSDKNTIIVSGLVHSKSYNCTGGKLNELAILGEWDNEVSLCSSVRNNDIPYDELLFCLRNIDVDHPQCRLLQKGRTIYHSMEPVIILYDLKKVIKSMSLLDEGACIDCKTSSLDTLYHAVKLAKLTFCQHDDLMIYSDQISLCSKSGKYITNTIISMISNCSFILSYISSIRLLDNPFAKALIAIPAVAHQFHRRYLDLLTLRSPQTSNICKYNITLRHFIDVFLGLALMVWFIKGDYAIILTNYLLSWAEMVALELQTLLAWLMGMPAGLKLNSQLDKLLGKFFQYHIYLWIGYLNFISPVLSSTLWYISLSGVMGLSAQLGLAQDLLSIMTIHIYCFYVYAARLYNLQMCALGSLWRLFRGKKWNVLRKRLDFASYDVDQLFIGSLLFTILLFLLPTTLLYYVVFTMLRLVVLSSQGIVNKILWFINNCNIFTLIVKIFVPTLLAREAVFHVLKRNPSRPLYLALELQAAECDLLQNKKTNRDQEENYTWTSFGKCLMSGKLVYPWIEK